MLIQIEKILRGIATGSYSRQVGSQFGSVWQFDQAEVTPQGYTVVGPSGDVQVSRAREIEWLGRKWAVILTYRRRGLARVTIHTQQDQLIIEATQKRLTSLLGKPKQSESAVWVGRDGVIRATVYGAVFQVDVAQLTPFQRLLAKIRSLF